MAPAMHRRARQSSTYVSSAHSSALLIGSGVELGDRASAEKQALECAVLRWMGGRVRDNAPRD